MTVLRQALAPECELLFYLVTGLFAQRLWDMRHENFRVQSKELDAREINRYRSTLMRVRKCPYNQPLGRR